MPKTLFLETPENFSFRQTIYSHGWCELQPFEIDVENWRLSYVFSSKNSKKPLSATISDADGKLKIEVADNKLNAETEEEILRDTRHILRLDDDLSDFYKNLKIEKRLAWIAKLKAGRLLRSPTVFEDLVKTICTTNCSWSLTKKMIANLVEKLGAETADGKRAFPTAETMANVPAEFYRDEMRAGYRAPYFAELAEKVAGGKINPEAWLDSDLPTKELKKEMKSVKGVGDYAAENLLKLVGRYDGLALDSWLRSQFYKKHNGETICADKEIENFYAKFGVWRGLAIWCDMTEKWFK
jgi:3-methyladenine DNA glycosylase/8-oxoguanine DNA glycosylase